MRGSKLNKIIDMIIGIPILFILGLLSKKNTEIPKNVRRILIVKLSAIGDSVLLIPVLREIRKRYPDAKISIICTDVNYEAINSLSYLDEIIKLNIKNMLFNPFSVMSAIRETTYDIALDFDQWIRISPLLIFLSGARYKVGFKTSGQMRHFIYDKTVDHLRDVHELDLFFKIAETVGVAAENKSLEYPLNKDDVNKAEEELKKAGIVNHMAFAVLHPETPKHGYQRMWPIENYIKLAGLMADNLSVKVLISSKDESMLLKFKTLKDNGKVIILKPQSLNVFASVLAKAKVLLCGNTGIMHLASALNIPIIALHGPTDVVKWGPLNRKAVVVKSSLECSPCLYLGFEYGCSENKCMKAIAVETVYSEIEKVVANSDKN